LQEKLDEPIQVKYLFNTALINALWSIMFGERIMHEDPESQQVFRCVAEITDEISALGSTAVFIPWIAKIAPRLSGFEKMVRGWPVVRSFLAKHVQSHNILYVENQPRDFIDVYMDEVKKTTDPESSFHEKQGTLVDTLMDMFSAATETTSTTLSWMLAYLIHHKEVQEKLQDEIDCVVGKRRHPSLTDRSSMPYTEAVIHEVLRFSSIIPFGIFHATTEDVNFHGFFIPKDTMIIPNYYSAHFDEAAWGDPENFRPERFIDEYGKFKKNENLLAFSTGKRVCLGEGLARDELFLFTVNLFQTFTATAAGKLPDLEPHVGFTLSPKPFKVNFTKRNEILAG
jgi:cytochrome P450